MTERTARTTFRRVSRLGALACLSPLAAALGGCALHFYDEATGTEHVWGLAHVKMRVQPSTEGVTALAQGSETLGFSAGRTAAGSHLALGWHDESRILVSPEDASLRFEWPTSDVFDVRVGAKPPFLQIKPQVTKEQP